METIETLADKAAVADALLRFANGMDTDEADLIRSAFTEDAAADFTAAATRLGIGFPLLEGQDAIVAGLTQFVGNLDTSHSVTNVRIELDGDTASMYALVEAQHLPLGVRDRHLLMKNRYVMVARREAADWRLTHMAIDNIWADGDISVVGG